MGGPLWRTGVQGWCTMYTFPGLYCSLLEEPYRKSFTMRTILLFCTAVFSFGYAQAQDCTGADHTVLAGNYYYIPSTLTVTAGETIAFQNEAGFHNVNGVSSTLGDTWNNPETFSLGATSGSAGGVCMGTITLSTPGTYHYDCSIGSHAANGMVGTIVVEAASSPNSPTDNAADPTLDEADVASVYSGSYTDIATNYNPNWWQSGTVDENFDPGTGNTVLYYSNFNFQGTDLTASNLSGMTHLHVDVWVPAGNDRMLKVAPINGGTGTGEWLVEVPMTPGAWNSVDLPKASFEGMTWDNVNQIKFDGQFNADGSSNGDPWDVYLDNIYFWDDGSGVISELDYVNVTFNVNMANEEVSTDGVFLAGGAEFGFPGDNPMSDDDGDGIWTITKEVISPFTGNYTFLNGNCGDWSCKEDLSGQDCADGQFNDRLLDNITEDHVVNTCFGECTTDGSCPPPPSVFHDVTFSVNTDNITVGPNGMYVGGGFLGGSDAYALTDNGDNNWSTTISIGEGTSGHWVFFNSPTHGGDWGTKEDLAGLDCGDPANFNDRFLPAVTEPMTEEYCFGTCEASCSAPPPPGNTYNVTFRVDMNDFDGDFDVVNVNGSFNGWCGGCNPMSDNNANGIYEVTLPLEEGTIEYKFTLDGWTQQEEFQPGGSCTSTIDGFTNRTLTFDADTDLATVCFNSCDACDGSGGGDPTEMYDVTFNVNTENISVGPNGMFLGGGVFGDAMAHAMSDDDADGTYTVTVNVAAGTAGNYVFLNSPNDGGDWGAKEILTGLPCSDPGNFDDRILAPVTENTTISTCFGQCSTDGTCEAPPTTYAVTFQVDMSDYTGAFGTVNLNGTFTGWCGGCIAMNDSDGDNVYTVTVDLAADTVEYKFTLDAWTAQEEFAGGESCTSTIDGFTNRSYIVDGDATLPVVCFNSCDACESEGDGGGDPTPSDSLAVSFSVDMNNYAGTFGFVNVSGTWNDFCGDCNQMTDDDMDGIWTATIDLPEGENYRYKFQVDAWADEEDLAPGDNPVGPCVVKSGGFTNRDLDVAGADPIALDTVCWGSCLACVGQDDILGCTDDMASNYDATATANDGSCIYDVTFSVNMSEYALAGTDSVYVNGEFNGWCGPCNVMLDEDGDGVYQTTIPLTYDYYEYKFTVNGWDAQENLAGLDGCVTENFGFTNRVLQLFGNQSEPVVCWNSCSNCEGSGAILGCTDPSASNYAATATEDDGSCQYPITFQVDMAGYGGSYGMVNLNGSFTGWCGACIVMDDADGDGIYAVTVDVPAGTVEYKFTVDAWTDQEFFTDGDVCTSTIDGFVNRTLDVSAAATLDVVCWNSCFSCDAPIGCTDSGAQNYDSEATIDDGSCAYLVTLQVDMSNQEVVSGTFVAGGFQGWDASGTPMDNPGLGLYTYTLQLANGTHDYKFINGGDWAGEESVPAECGADNGQGGYNRQVVVAGSDMTVDVVCFGECAACAGCTDPLSAEFSPFAGSDDGSCATPLVFGCTYSDADNYNAAANSEDGSCEFSGGSSCLTDIDGDGATAVGDLLIILGAFGQTCEE
jgi:plastocyanin